MEPGYPWLPAPFLSAPFQWRPSIGLASLGHSRLIAAVCPSPPQAPPAPWETQPQWLITSVSFRGALLSVSQPKEPVLCLRLLLSKTLFSVPGAGGWTPQPWGGGWVPGLGPGWDRAALPPPAPAPSPPPPALQAAVPP